MHPPIPWPALMSSSLHVPTKMTMPLSRRPMLPINQNPNISIAFLNCRWEQFITTQVFSELQLISFSCFSVAVSWWYPCNRVLVGAGTLATCPTHSRGSSITPTEIWDNHLHLSLVQQQLVSAEPAARQSPSPRSSPKEADWDDRGRLQLNNNYRGYQWEDRVK